MSTGCTCGTARSDLDSFKLFENELSFQKLGKQPCDSLPSEEAFPAQECQSYLEAKQDRRSYPQQYGHQCLLKTLTGAAAPLAQ